MKLNRRLVSGLTTCAGLTVAFSIATPALADSTCPNDPDQRQSATNQSQVGAFSARKCDTKPTPKAVLYDEVFVVSGAPERGNEARSIKGAYAKVKSGGIIYLTEAQSGLSNDNSGLLITKPVTIDLDSDLRTQFDIDGKSQVGKVTAAIDGTCFIMAAAVDRRESPRMRDARMEVTLRDIRLEANIAGAAGTCLTVNGGDIFLDNVDIGSSAQPFQTGILQRGGRVVNVRSLNVNARKMGIHVEGGVFDSAEGTSNISGHAIAAETEEPAFDTNCGKSDRNKHTIGVLADRAQDKRAGDPQVTGDFHVDGFDIGVCAWGDGVEINKGIVGENDIGVLANGRMTMRQTEVRLNKYAGLVLSNPEGEFVQNEIVSNRRGVILQWADEYSNLYRRSGRFGRAEWERRELKYGQREPEQPPLLHRNMIAFNGRGVGLADTPNRSPDEEVIDKYYKVDITANTVTCNITPGAVAVMDKFRRTNVSRKENREDFCSRRKNDDYCRNIDFIVESDGCGGLDWLRAERADLLASWAKSLGAPQSHAQLKADMQLLETEDDVRDYLVNAMSALPVKRRAIKKEVKSAFKTALERL
ncbi:MAG: hypothetical protein AAFR21_02765 [Pseudomonadota bacterium]